EGESCGNGGGREGSQFDIREGGFFSHVLVVGADADARIERSIEMQFDGCANLVERLVAHAEEHGNGVAALLKPESVRRIDVELDVLRGCGGCTTVLKSGHAGPVLGCVCVDAVGVKGLTKYENRFAMRTGMAGGVGKHHV